MSRAFYYKWSDKQTIDDVDQVIGRLTLPAGNYIIIGEASVAASELNETIDCDQPLECKLKAGTVEDKIMLNVWSDRFHSGNWGVITLNLEVKVAGGTAELICTHGNPGCISVFDVALTAIEVEYLQVSEHDRSIQHKTYMHPQIQKRTVMRFPTGSSPAINNK